MKNYKLDSQNLGAQWDDLDRLSQMQSDWPRQGEAERLQSQWLLAKEHEEDANLRRIFGAARPQSHVELCKALIQFWKRAAKSTTCKREAELAFAIAYQWIKSNGGLSRTDAECVGERLAAGANPWPDIHAAMLEIPLMDRRKPAKGGPRGRRCLDAGTSAVGCIFSFVENWLANRPGGGPGPRAEWVAKIVRVPGGALARPKRHTDDGEWVAFDQAAERPADSLTGERPPCPPIRSASRKARRRK